MKTKKSRIYGAIVGLALLVPAVCLSLQKPEMKEKITIKGENRPLEALNEARVEHVAPSTPQSVHVKMRGFHSHLK